MGYIYQLKCIVNDLKYVGQTINFKRRKYEHINNLRKNKHINTHLQNAWNKHGEKNFIFEIIENVKDDNLLTEREQFWVDNTPKELLYNVCIECVDSSKGTNHTKETKIKLRKSHLKLTELEMEEVCLLAYHKYSGIIGSKKCFNTKKGAFPEINLRWNISHNTIGRIYDKREQYGIKKCPLETKRRMSESKIKLTDLQREEVNLLIIHKFNGIVGKDIYSKKGAAPEIHLRFGVSANTALRIYQTRESKLKMSHIKSKLSYLEKEEICLLIEHKYNNVIGEYNTKIGAYPEIYVRWECGLKNIYYIRSHQDKWMPY